LIMANILWAPWRMEYIMSDKSKDCIFCIGKDEAQDKEKGILYRSNHAYVILNRYPYNNGHLMVSPFQHSSKLEEVDEATGQDMFWLLQRSLEILRKSLRPDGFNIGVNLGRVAGAGIEAHLHVHIVPRWNGDTNFLPVVGEVRVISEALQTSYENLYPYFRELRKKPVPAGYP
jgi:ATP adenylyltransferase